LKNCWTSPGATTGWQVGDPAFGFALTVTAANRREALKLTKPQVRAKLAAISAETAGARMNEKRLHREERLERARAAEGQQKPEGSAR
jgi:hypothetical protein